MKKMIEFLSFVSMLIGSVSVFVACLLSAFTFKDPLYEVGVLFFSGILTGLSVAKLYLMIR